MKTQITIKKIQEILIKGVKTIHVDDDTSRRMWWASLEVIQKDFLPQNYKQGGMWVCLLYTSDAADDTPCVDLGGRRIIKSWQRRGNPHPSLFIILRKKIFLNNL